LMTQKEKMFHKAKNFKMFHKAKKLKQTEWQGKSNAGQRRFGDIFKP